MSNKGDFLSGFSGGNTQKPLTEQNTTPVKDTNPNGTNKTNTPDNKNVSQQKDKIQTPPLPGSSGVATRPAQNASSVIKAPEHVVTRDEKFHKRALIKYSVIGASAVFLAIIAFFIFRASDTITVRNWVGESFEDAQTWSLIGGGANVEQNLEWNLEYAEGIIISQNVEPGERMSSRGLITFTVSRGPNMDEVIELPDFTTMTRQSVDTWRRANHVPVTFRPQPHDEIPNHGVIDVDFPSTVDPNHFRRRDTVFVYVSEGPQTFQIGNLVNFTPQQLANWREQNPDVILEINYEASEDIARGVVMRQSVAAGTRLPVGEALTLTISGGNPVEVPNFAYFRRGQLDEVEADGLKIEVQDRYHGTVPLGQFIYQSVEAGTELFGEDAFVTVRYSLGRPWIPIIGMENHIQETFLGFANRGAPNVRFTVEPVDHYELRGTVLSQTHYNQFVGLDTVVHFKISRGNLNPPVEAPPEVPPGDTPLPPPTTITMPRTVTGAREDSAAVEEFVTRAEIYNIEVAFDRVNNLSVPHNHVLRVIDAITYQVIAPGSQIESGRSIIIEVAYNPDFEGGE